MAFRFTPEDFVRYVKVSEHGGIHIWHELQQRLEEQYKRAFGADPWIAQGDRLAELWLHPKDTVRQSWRYQAQFYFARSIDQNRIEFGLCIERPPVSYFELTQAEKHGWNPSHSDGNVFLDLLQQDPEFLAGLGALLVGNEWNLSVEFWGTKTNTLIYEGSDLAQFVEKLSGVQPEKGLNMYIRQLMSAEDAISAGEEIADLIAEAYFSLDSIWKAVMPEPDRHQIERDPPPPPPPPAPPSTVLDLIRSQLRGSRLHFTDWQIATFYTALQTKGFVILSGISGTGKTKLAQHFAAMLPKPRGAGQEIDSDDVSVISIRPYMIKYGRFIIPQSALRLFEPPAKGQSFDVDVRFDTKTQKCRLTRWTYGNTDVVALLLRGGARSWFMSSFGLEEKALLRPLVNDDNTLIGFQIEKWDSTSAPPLSLTGGDAHNHIFVAVRPDWRDGKSLLGYYNPLTQNYERTPFLDFLLHAVEDYKAKDRLAWFVILDEMNLARVEYYFADLLSVLESGRDESGWTREPVRFSYPDDAQGDLPPRDVKLPPNLYIIGTVNVDETTHAFSPKVLDRAFNIELTEVNFTSYATPVGEVAHLSDDLRWQLLKSFTQEGAFARIDKDKIADFIAWRSNVRSQLQLLNKQLQPHDLHFGYRVFDEIVAFLHNAERNHTFDDLGGWEAAFDAAVLMKVLPKFHGSRARLEQPLQNLLAWCLNPDFPSNTAISEQLKNADMETLQSKLFEFNFRYPKTAERAARMLWSLHVNGFAAFG